MWPDLNIWAEEIVNVTQVSGQHFSSSHDTLLSEAVMQDLWLMGTDLEYKQEVLQIQGPDTVWTYNRIIHSPFHWTSQEESGGKCVSCILNTFGHTQLPSARREPSDSLNSSPRARESDTVKSFKRPLFRQSMTD